ncbi:UNKNOWN [Stylonychia lemnae]|uniref:Uncharacterized protein n=1 Tax=Stylonychia lemnae TaxID=5949 RepID=A0A077ZSR2_STYLE|nr:UNKNOWN [Stylonychia lemnae]|eukprot:CDW72350.1 UNKNOWN [Stylonychia lemnae]
MLNVATQAILILVLVSTTNAWPGYKSSQQKKTNSEFCYETNGVHGDCGTKYKIRGNHPENVKLPPAFIMEFEQSVIECELNDPHCFPPFYPSATEQLQGRYPITIGKGFTYFNSTHRGGSQVEYYSKNCVPVFQSYIAHFQCTLYIINDTQTAYFTTENGPKEFGDCCILTKGFHPPRRDFIRNLNYTGIKTYGVHHQKYHSFTVKTNEGEFCFNFWDKEMTDKHSGEKYHEPAFFEYEGFQKSTKNTKGEPQDLRIFQTFHNIRTDPFNPEDYFTLPAACNPDAPRCPDYDHSAYNKHMTFMQ